MKRGRFITFEGGEGAGKSTQVKLLAERLLRAGIETTVTREPGGSPFAEEVRALILDPGKAPTSPLAEAMLFSAARADHLAVTIRPALEAGRWVLCDRFADSTRVYQGVAGGLAPATIDTLEQLAVGADKPALTLLLDLDPKIGMTRANTRRAAVSPGTSIAADTFEGRDLAFHQKLRQGFLAIAQAEPARVAVIDAHQNPLAVADAIWVAVGERLGPSPAMSVGGR